MILDLMRSKKNDKHKVSYVFATYDVQQAEKIMENLRCTDDFWPHDMVLPCMIIHDIVSLEYIKSDSVRLRDINKFPAKNGLLIQNITKIISWYGWIILLLVQE